MRSRSAGASQRERLDPAQDEAAVERAGHRAERLLEEEEPLRDRRRRRRDEAADDVGVAAEVLRRRVDDDVGAELERALEVRRRERVVDDEQRAGLVRGVGGRAMSTMFSIGFDGVSTQTMRVRSSRCAARFAELWAGTYSKRSPSARRPETHAVDAAVDVVDSTTRSPGSRRCISVVVAPSPDEKATPCSALSSDARHASSAVRVGFPCASSRSPCACRPPPARTSRSGRSASYRPAGRRVGLLPGVDRARLEVHATIVGSRGGATGTRADHRAVRAVRPGGGGSAGSLRDVSAPAERAGARLRRLRRRRASNVSEDARRRSSLPGKQAASGIFPERHDGAARSR